MVESLESEDGMKHNEIIHKNCGGRIMIAKFQKENEFNETFYCFCDKDILKALTELVVYLKRKGLLDENYELIDIDSEYWIVKEI